MDFEVTNRTERGWTWVDVSGEVDLYTSGQLKEHLAGLIADGDRRVVADLSAVDFMDSSGLGALVGGLKRMREQEGTFAIVCPGGGSVAKVLAITGLDKVFEIYATSDEVPEARTGAGGAPRDG